MAPHVKYKITSCAGSREQSVSRARLTSLVARRPRHPTRQGMRRNCLPAPCALRLAPCKLMISDEGRWYLMQQACCATDATLASHISPKLCWDRKRAKAPETNTNRRLNYVAAGCNTNAAQACTVLLSVCWNRKCANAFETNSLDDSSTQHAGCDIHATHALLISHKRVLGQKTSQRDQKTLSPRICTIGSCGTKNTIGFQTIDSIM